jgi:hypothetical protein
VIIAMLVAMIAPATVVAKPPSDGAVTKPVTGSFVDAVGGTGTFAGSFQITGFSRQGGGIVAVGNLTGTLTDSLGTVLGTVSRSVTLPVTTLQATCDILHLELGPLDLNLLGLVVHLDKVVLDITAQQGPGNLLGNLLCAIAGLLDPGPGPLGAITALLNRILAILQGL